MSRYNIIGLCGQAGSGKDTCADLIVARSPRGVVKLAFADPLKEEVSQSFGIDPIFLHAQELKCIKYGSLAIHRSADIHFIDRMKEIGEDIHCLRSPRQIMQLWGTEYRRADDRDYWTEKMLSYIHAHIGYGQKIFVLSDVRFVNEAQLVLNCGGTLIMVKRGSDKSASHESESTSSLEPLCTAILSNDKSISELEINLRSLLKI